MAVPTPMTARVTVQGAPALADWKSAVKLVMADSAIGSGSSRLDVSCKADDGREFAGAKGAS
jgi:hypothetical protein